MVAHRRPLADEALTNSGQGVSQPTGERPRGRYGAAGAQLGLEEREREEGSGRVGVPWEGDPDRLLRGDRCCGHGPGKRAEGPRELEDGYEHVRVYQRRPRRSVHRSCVVAWVRTLLRAHIAPSGQTSAHAPSAAS